eukprot:scaffold1290_cov367-Prasinococcus_capsulatus_cf.AAC.8
MVAQAEHDSAGAAGAARSDWPLYLSREEQVRLGEPLAVPVPGHEASGARIFKQVVDQGAGEVAPRHGKALVHYRSWIEASGQLVRQPLASLGARTGTEPAAHDTWEDGQPLSMVVGRFRGTRRQEGLDALVQSMQAGERCLATVPSELAYGDEGNFSFPHVPPNGAPANAEPLRCCARPCRSTLVYLVELLAVEPPDESVAKSDMTFEGRCEKAERLRLEGNELFKADQIEEALSKYIVALSYITDEMMYQVFGHYKAYGNSVRLPTMLNKAACHLRLKQYEQCIADCSTVLAEEEAQYKEEADEAEEKARDEGGIRTGTAEAKPHGRNPKALYRRGCAKFELGQLDAAKKDLKEALAGDPKNVGIRNQLKKVQAEELAIAKQRKENFKGLFGPSPASHTSEHDARPGSGQATGAGHEASAGASIFAMIGVLLRRFLEFIFGLFGASLHAPARATAGSGDSLEEEVRAALHGSQDAAQAAERIETLYKELQHNKSNHFRHGAQAQGSGEADIPDSHSLQGLDIDAGILTQHSNLDSDAQAQRDAATRHYPLRDRTSRLRPSITSTPKRSCVSRVNTCTGVTHAPSTSAPSDKVRSCAFVTGCIDKPTQSFRLRPTNTRPMRTSLPPCR